MTDPQPPGEDDGQDGALYQLKIEASGTVGTGTGPPVPGDDNEDEEPA